MTDRMEAADRSLAVVRHTAAVVPGERRTATERSAREDEQPRRRREGRRLAQLERRRVFQRDPSCKFERQVCLDARTCAAEAKMPSGGSTAPSPPRLCLAAPSDDDMCPAYRHLESYTSSRACMTALSYCFRFEGNLLVRRTERLFRNYACSWEKVLSSSERECESAHCSGACVLGRATPRDDPTKRWVSVERALQRINLLPLRTPRRSGGGGNGRSPNRGAARRRPWSGTWDRARAQWYPP